MISERHGGRYMAPTEMPGSARQLEEERPPGEGPSAGMWDKPEEAASKRLSQWPLIFSQGEEKEGRVSDNQGNLRG